VQLEEDVKNRNVTIGLLLAVTAAMASGSVLLLGYGLFVLALVVVSLGLIGIAIYQSRGKASIEGLESMPMVIAAIAALTLLELHRAPAGRVEMLPAVHATEVASTRETRPAGADEAWGHGFSQDPRSLFEQVHEGGIVTERPQLQQKFDSY
jgi:hypothetical protein